MRLERLEVKKGLALNTHKSYYLKAMTEANKRFLGNRIHILLLLILAGESVFILPFVLARVFRPTFLEAFQLDNTALGECFAIYGIVALISYLLGGRLADQFSPRILVATGLISTAAGGFYMATFPDLFGLKVLFGYWGFTTIFLFWAAMLKATRVWGGESRQVMAFGVLEAGRGTVAATLGLVCVFIFSALVGDNVDHLDFNARQAGLKEVILFLSFFVTAVGIAVLLFLKTNQTSAQNNADQTSSRERKYYLEAIKLPSVKLLMLIVLSAYVGYKVTGIMPQHAKEIVGVSELSAAKLATSLLYMRPVAAILVVLLAIKYKIENGMMIGFGLMVITSGIYATGILGEGMLWLTVANILFLSLGIFSTRALYFALMQKGQIPIAITGSAIGLISVVGYLPDIFMGPLIGHFLDDYPLEVGYQLLFLSTTGFALLGLIASWMFRKYYTG